MFILTHIGSFTGNDRCETKVIGIYNDESDLHNILEEFRQCELEMFCDEDDDFNTNDYKIVKVKMNLKHLFDDYHTDKWVVYKFDTFNTFNTFNGASFKIDGIEPYAVYILKFTE